MLLPGKIVFVILVHVILLIYLLNAKAKAKMLEAQSASSSQPLSSSQPAHMPAITRAQIAIYYAVGLLFGFGLGLSGMLKRSKIVGFLRFDSNWDPSLLFVLATPVLINLVTFQYMIHRKKSFVFNQQVVNPQNKVDLRLYIGGVLFGLGWGLGGLCPGPIIGLTPLAIPSITVYWVISFIIGQQIIELIDQAQKMRKEAASKKNN